MKYENPELVTLDHPLGFEHKALSAWNEASAFHPS
jgi:hypothetical protein